MNVRPVYLKALEKLLGGQIRLLFKPSHEGRKNVRKGGSARGYATYVVYSVSLMNRAHLAFAPGDRKALQKFSQRLTAE